MQVIIIWQRSACKNTLKKTKIRKKHSTKSGARHYWAKERKLFDTRGYIIHLLWCNDFCCLHQCWKKRESPIFHKISMKKFRPKFFKINSNLNVLYNYFVYKKDLRTYCEKNRKCGKILFRVVGDSIRMLSSSGRYIEAGGRFLDRPTWLAVLRSLDVLR